MNDSPLQVKLRTETEAETRALGERLGLRLGPNDVVCLVGELGAGKTTLAQGIAAGLGVEEPVSSPTFNLLQEYAGRVPVFHLDAYRVASLDELIDLGFPELWRAGGVLLIEWPERIAPALPPDRLEIRLTALPGPGEQTPRELTLTAHGPRAAHLLEELATPDKETW